VFELKRVSIEESVLVVKGSLSAPVTAEFQDNLERLFAEGRPIATLDFREVDSIGSAALGKVLLFRKMFAEQGRTLRIRGCSEALLNTFKMINFGALISIER
jgi:anti-anti-sigma factor